MKSLQEFLLEWRSDLAGNSLNPVILSVAKDPQDAGSERELTSFLTGTLCSEKAGKSEVKSTVQGSFAALRMTEIMEPS